MLRALRLAICLMCFGLTSTSTISANEFADSPFPIIEHQDPVAADLYSEEYSVQPGRPFWVAVRLNIEEGWHAYWKNPGDAGMAPLITWQLPDGFTSVETLWPTPKRFTLGSNVGFGYENELILLTKINPPKKLQKSTVTIAAHVRWVVCSDSSCLPGENQLKLNVPVNSQLPIVDAHFIEFFKNARQKIPQKRDLMTAQRKNDLIEINILDSSLEKIDCLSAEFFPEVSQTIDQSTEILLLHPSENSKSYSVVLRELNTVDSLKGILVLHTATKAISYDIDVPVSASEQVDKEAFVLASSSSQAKLDGHSLSDHAENLTDPFAFQGGLFLALIFAFIGGLILNLMPCVLPVLSFKILGFIKLAGQSRRLIVKHGIAFTFGVLISFWILAAFLLILQTYGRSVGWGFQLQEPIFVAILSAFLFLFALSLFGLFEIGTSLIAAAGQMQQGKQRHALTSSFLSGILATAVATPCTGPFLGSAVGFAVTLPAFQALLIFTSLGLGMSMPYLVLAIFPSLLRFMPKPGPWMSIFKELMGFLMLASVLWLVWVFSAQTSSLSVAMLLAAFFLLSIAGWIYGRWSNPLHKPIKRMIGTIFAFIFFSFGSYAVVMSASPAISAMDERHVSLDKTEGASSDVWEDFSPKRIAELRKQGVSVFVDFTAKWCLICQANHLVLSKRDVAEKFTSLGVVRMKADWTKNDKTITEELRKFGRNSVPLYVLYGPDPESSPKIFPQVLTPEIVLTSLKTLEEAI